MTNELIWIRPAELDERWKIADLRIFLESHGQDYRTSAADAELREQVQVFLTS